VAPPLFVATSVPKRPTAKQAFALGQLTPSSQMAPDVWEAHVLPALVVARTVLPRPTAKHVVSLAQLIAFRSCVVPAV
jgi:hypothetical protein